MVSNVKKMGALLVALAAYTTMILSCNYWDVNSDDNGISELFINNQSECYLNVYFDDAFLIELPPSSQSAGIFSYQLPLGEHAIEIYKSIEGSNADLILEKVIYVNGTEDYGVVVYQEDCSYQ